MDFKEKASFWMGLHTAMTIVQSQEDNNLKPVAVKALEMAIKMVEDEAIKQDKRICRQQEINNPTFLNALIKKKGITQKDIASHFGIAQQSVGQWQQKRRIPRAKFKAFCDFLSVTEDEKLELLKMQNGVD